MDATRELLGTVATRGMGYETCREFARMSHRVLPGCRDHRKRELINW